MTLFDKFMLLDICENDMPPEGPVTLATNEELHDMQLLMELDKDAICETLDYLLEMKKRYYAYGKCGKAYFGFMKMENEISLVRESIRQYDDEVGHLIENYMLDSDTVREYKEYLVEGSTYE